MVLTLRFAAKVLNTDSLIVTVNIGISALDGKYLAGQSSCGGYPIAGVVSTGGRVKASLCRSSDGKTCPGVAAYEHWGVGQPPIRVGLGTRSEVERRGDRAMSPVDSLPGIN